MTNLFGSAEIWQDGAWQAAPCEGGECRAPNIKDGCPPGVPCPPVPQRFPGMVNLVVPAAGVRDGVLYVRVQAPASFQQSNPLTLGRSA
jgi:hypothetical protein